MGLDGSFWIVLGLPRLSEAAFAPLARFGSHDLVKNARHESFGGSVLIGASTGLLWRPVPAHSRTGVNWSGHSEKCGPPLGFLLAYSLGAATSLAMALWLEIDFSKHSSVFGCRPGHKRFRHSGLNGRRRHRLQLGSYGSHQFINGVWTAQ